MFTQLYKSLKHKNVDILKSQQALTELSIVRYESGQLPAPRRKQYVNLDQRIFRVVSAYAFLNAISYLDTISGLKLFGIWF